MTGDRDTNLRYHAGGGARPMAAGRVMVVGAVAFLVAGLLNAESLHDQANRQPFGWKRDVARAVVWPLRSVSHVTGLDRPRRAIETAIGRSPEERAGSTERARRSGISRAPSVELSDDAPPPAFALRQPTTAEPLRMWIGGDSMTQVFGESLVTRCGERGTLACTLDERISTGLTRPDYFDWPAHLADEVLPTDPEVVVIMFGANDAQGMELEAGVFQVADQQWQDEYRTRVGATMDLLAGDGRLVIWVGQPVMRSAGFDGRMEIVDRIYAEEAATRPWVRFLDSRPVLAPDGGYQAYLPDGSGDDQLARNPDGIHLTRFGGDVLADAVLAVLDRELAAASRTPAPSDADQQGSATTGGR